MGKVSMPQGKGSLLHNRREYEKIGKPFPDNINVSKCCENITMVDRDIKQAYVEIFGEALKQYNSKQKRADRKIESYYDHIQKSKNGEKLFYEDVVQWGKIEDFQNSETREKAKNALVKYVERFEERNPNLKLIGAYIHMDEASPHLHLDYIPVAHGYSRGMAIRNSLDRAMKEMGFVPENESRKNNATKLWKERERAVFGNICCSFGLEVDTERKSSRKSLSVEEYKDARSKMLVDLIKEEFELKSEISALESKKSALQIDSKKIFDLKHVEEKKLSEVKSELLRAYQKLSRIKKLENNIAELMNIEPKKNTLIGNDCVVDLNDWKKMKAAAISGCSAVIEVERLSKLKSYQTAYFDKAKELSDANDKIYVLENRLRDFNTACKRNPEIEKLVEDEMIKNRVEQTQKNNILKKKRDDIEC